MNIFKTLALLIGVALIAYIGSHYALSKSGMVAHETAYERVLRTGTLRCGTFIEPPFTILNTDNTEKGIAHDLALQIASELSLKVEWGETNFSTLADDLKMGRYDAICASVFVLPRGGRVDYTMPYAYVPVYGYVNAKDDRFDRPFSEIDWSKVTIGGLDGEGATLAAQKILSKAKFDILPQSLQIADMLGAVVSHKTDVGFVQPTVFQTFDAYNKGVLQKAFLGAPLYNYAVVFAVSPEEQGLKSLLNNEILRLKTSGELARIMDVYDAEKFVTRP